MVRLNKLNLTHYLIDDKGNIFTDRNGVLKQLRPYLDSKKRYLQIKLTQDDGQRRPWLIHRLVALTFLPNPKNLSDVNHKNHNSLDNRVQNLEWISHKSNIYHSYEIVSAKRNFKICDLYYKKNFIKTFESLKDAAKFANDIYGVSYHSLIKYKKCKNVFLELR